MSKKISIEERLSKRFCDSYLLGDDLNSIDKIKIQYGLSILLINLAKVFQVYFVSLMLGVLNGTIICHVSFLIVRKYTYGFHSKNSYYCTLYGLFFFSGIPYLISKYKLILKNTELFLIAVICIAIVASLAPQATSRSIIKNERMLKIKSVKVSMILTVSSILLPFEYAKTYLIYGLLVATVLLIINKICNGK
ncbi:accessory gene regulator B family protein [Enterococcus faecalis]